MQLKYLFTVEYTDGSKFSQNKEDVSAIDLQRSAFYDVLQSGKTVKRFSLVEQAIWNPKTISVDLIDGHFELNNISFTSEADRPLPAIPDKFTIVFYRQHQHDIQQTHNVKTGELIKRKETDHRIRYFLGWQATIAGKNYQQVIGIN